MQTLNFMHLAYRLVAGRVGAFGLLIGGQGYIWFIDLGGGGGGGRAIGLVMGRGVGWGIMDYIGAIRIRILLM